MASDAAVLTRSFRASQQRRAALVAALVSVYFNRKVKISDSEAVERFLALMVPKVLEEHDSLALQASLYGDRVRKLELPNTNVPYKFEPITSITEDQIRASIQAVGVNSFLKKVGQIEALPNEQYPPSIKKALIEEADKTASARVASAVSRHVQNGARRTLEDGSKNDPMTIGYVRVTRADPCFFCAMLASRGLEGGLYQRDSFDASDPRFVGDGTAKVHDGCGCSIKPVYTRGDSVLATNQKFTDAWYNMSGNGDADPLTNFRRNWEGRATHLKKNL